MSKKKDSTKEGKKNRYPYLDTMFVMRWATTRGLEKRTQTMQIRKINKKSSSSSIVASFA